MEAESGWKLGGQKGHGSPGAGGGAQQESPLGHPVTPGGGGRQSLQPQCESSVHSQVAPLSSGDRREEEAAGSLSGKERKRGSDLEGSGAQGVFGS